MARPLVSLAVKEIKELLRDRLILFGMIIVPMLMFPAMGGAIQVGTGAVQEATRQVDVTLVDLDGGRYATDLVAFFRLAPNVKVNSANSLDEAFNQDLGKPVIAVVIPREFSANVTNGIVGTVEIHSLLQSFSIAETTRASTIDALVNAYRNRLALEIAQEHIPDRDPASVLNPLTTAHVAYVKGKPAHVSPQVLSGLITSQTIMMPIIIMILLIFAMQIAATSMAMEKEEKTLETILSLPVSRLSILTSKLAGSVFVAAIAAAAYMIGFSYYMGSLAGIGGREGANIDLASLGLTYTPFSFLLLGLSLFMALVAALALAISISVFAEDVRGAQSLVGALIIPIIIPSILLMFSDVNTLPMPLQLVIYGIPFSHPIIAAKAALLGDYVTIGFGIAYTAAFTVFVLYAAAKLFTTEKIVTARLTRRRPTT